MGKIGDLIVRLQLKYEDYKKGLKQAEKDTRGFASTLGKIKGVGLAVWGAIGGAVLKVASGMVKSTNEMEDKWAMFVTKAKAGWQTFMRTLSNGDWGNFFKNFKAEIAAAAALQEVLDADTEIMNSIRIEKSKMAEELAKLEIAMRDQSKSYKDRAAAAELYMKKVLPLYDKEIKRAEKLKAAQYKAFLGNKYSDRIYTNKANQALWDMMLVEYGNLDPVINGRTFNEIVARYLNPNDYITPFSESEVKHQLEFQAIVNEFSQLADWLTKAYNEKYAGQFITNADDVFGFMSTFFKQYEKNRNGEDVDLLVDAVVGLDQAKAAMDEETKKVQTLLASMSGKVVEESKLSPLEALPPITGQAIRSFDVPDIIPDDWLTRNREKIDAAVEEAKRLQGITDEINKQFNDAVVSSLSGATQALAECIMGIEGADASQVLSALLQPFAQTMVSLGEMLLAEGLAIEVFKTSLKSLQGAPAIAAGLGLIALGSALAAGIKALGGASSSSTSGGSYDSASSSASGGIETYEQEITVHVVGEISGDKIVLAGQKTLNKWNR